MSGFLNLGNSCYMNSILQCLIHTKDMTEFIILNKYKEDFNKNKNESYLLNEYINILQLYAKNNIIKPIHFKNILGKLNENFNNMYEQDSHEFLVYVVDTFHNALSYPVKITFNGKPISKNDKFAVKAIDNWNISFKKEYSKIISIFYGQYHSQLICKNEKGNCNNISNKFEPFCYLPLSIPEKKEDNNQNINIYDLLNDFVKMEELSNDNNWKCNKCKNNETSQKFIYIWKCPDVLIIQLKRFDAFGNKINTHIDIPFELDIGNYSSKYNNKNTKYNLYSICNHIGNLDGGHYYSYCKDRHNTWREFDDNNMNVMDAKNVITPHAYLLFYKCGDCRPRS